MGTLQGPIEFNQRWAALGLLVDTTSQCLLCTTCCYAIKPSGDAISRHLSAVHHIPFSARIGINEWVKALALPDPAILPPRPDGGPPHPHLEIRKGAICRVCDFRTTSLDLLRRHMSRQHQRRGNRKVWARDEVETDVAFQCWTPRSHGSFWQVQATPSATESLQGSLNASPQRRRHVAMLHEQELERLDRHEQAPQPSSADAQFQSNWLRRAGWSETLKGSDLALLSALRIAPAVDGFSTVLSRDGEQLVESSVEDERCLALVGAAVDRFFAQCEDTARHTDHSVRCWLRSQMADRPYKAPFEVPWHSSTCVKYYSVWKSMLYFLLRLSHLADPHSSRTGRIKLSTAQENKMHQLWQVARHVLRSSGVARKAGVVPTPLQLSLLDGVSYQDSPSDEMSGCDSCSDSGNESADQDPIASDSNECYNQVDATSSRVRPYVASADQAREPANRPPLVDELRDAVARLSFFLATENFTNSSAASTALIAFSAKLGISTSATKFDLARNYTPKLSALIYCIRICLLEATLPRYAHPSIGWPARPTTGGLEQLNEVRRRFMCSSCQAPMGELLSLRAYGRATHYAQFSRPS